MKGAIALAVTAVLLAAGCGDGSSSGEADVVATTTQLADIARSVAGDDVVVTQLLRPNADPHNYEPRPSDVRELERARLVLRSGGDVDEWLDELMESSDSAATVVQPFRARLRSALVAGPPQGRAGGCGHPRRPDRAGPQGRREPRATSGGCASSTVRSGAASRKLPPGSRKLVTTHDALGHYADRYGLEVIGAVIPSRSSQAQPSSKDVGELVDQIKEEKVKAIFPESSLSSKLEDAIARESGAKVGGEAVGRHARARRARRGATYIESIEANTRTIVEGLSGGKLSCF